MSIAMALASFSWTATLDMVRAVGSVFTRQYRGSLFTAMLLHLLTGIIFAFVYARLWLIFQLSDLSSYVFAGVMTGFAHGFVVSFLLIVAVAEHSPIARFRRLGFGVAISNIVGHIVFGTVVAIILWTF